MEASKVSTILKQRHTILKNDPLLKYHPLAEGYLILAKRFSEASPNASQVFFKASAYNFILRAEYAHADGAGEQGKLQASDMQQLALNAIVYRLIYGDHSQAKQISEKYSIDMGDFLKALGTAVRHLRSKNLNYNAQMLEFKEGVGKEPVYDGGPRTY